MVPGRINKIINFAMNYSDDHREEAQADFFFKNQTTLLPVVVWFRALTELDGELKMHQHIRVYLTAERQHSNNLVQKVLDSFLAYFKEVMGKAAAGLEECAMRWLCVWSDWYGGQFKSRWQMRKLLGLVNDKRINLEGTEHRAPSTIYWPDATVSRHAMGWEGGQRRSCGTRR